MIDDAKTWGLSTDEKAFYDANGYLLVPGVFDAAEAAWFRAEAHRLATRLAAAGDKGFDYEGWQSGAKVTSLPRRLVHCHNVQFHSAAFTRLITDPRLTDRAADLIGPNVMLHHTKMFIKPPEKGAPFPMHQDVPYFPFRQDSMIAAIVHLDDAPLEKGCVRVMPGSHKLGRLEHIEEGSDHLPPKRYPIDDATPCPARAGDVLFFSYLTVHGSGVNASREARTTLLVQMRDPADEPEEATHLSRGQGMMLRGIDPTTDADSSVRSLSRFLGRGGSKSPR